MRRAKYKLREAVVQKLFLWCVPFGLAIATLVTDIANEGISVGGLIGAYAFGAIFVGLNRLYFAMTHRVIFKDRILDVRFHRNGHFITYDGIT